MDFHSGIVICRRIRIMSDVLHSYVSSTRNGYQFPYTRQYSE